jgi:transcriptional regulator of acetoin/glycerol metabolism
MAATPPARGAARPERPRERERPIAAALGLPPAHEELIQASHERCAALGLSRIERPDFAPLGRSDLQVARERNRRLHDHAAPVMEMLFEQIVSTGSMVVLCDASGTVIHSIGDDAFLERAAKVALAPGANWSETSKGTNGIGTALMAELPTLVHADEHYLHANHFLTCSAAPIVDPRGNVLGVLDVSGERHSYHPHTMALVRMSARMIENQWLQDSHQQALRLHFHARLGHVGSLLEGILAVSPDGRVLGANRSASELLQASVSGLRQRTLQDLFGTAVGDLVDHFRSPLAVPLQLRGPDGRPFFVHARFDWPVWRDVAEAAARQIGEADLRAAAAAATPAPPPAPHAVAALPALPAFLPAAAVAAVAAGRNAGDPAPTLGRLLTGDARVAAAVSQLQRLAPHPVPVLLHGEAGTGKATLARAWHAASGRASQPVWTVDAMALGPGGLAGELARLLAENRNAPPGLLLLLNVDELPADAQAPLLGLLRSLDDAHRRPAWAGPQTPAVLATARRPARELAATGTLRQDLAFRLAGLALSLPPLRERSDLPALAQQILGHTLQRTDLTLAADTLARLQAHDWPGNLRELVNVLRSAVLMAEGAAVLQPWHLPADTGAEGAGAAVAETARVATDPAPGARPLRQVERDAIERAVAAAGGNLAEAARQLGVSRNTLYRRLRWVRAPQR